MPRLGTDFSVCVIAHAKDTLHHIIFSLLIHFFRCAGTSSLLYGRISRHLSFRYQSFALSRMWDGKG